jgi:glycosyltransferase involved in cell wall biosynthesis
MVTPSYYPIVGGTESIIENTSIKLNDMGVQTDVMTFNIDEAWKPWSINQIRKSKTVEINGVKVMKIRALTLLPTRILFRTNFIPAKFANQLMNYDIIHFHNDVDLSFPIFSHSIDKPKILHCHLLNVTHSSYKKNPVQKRIFKMVADVYMAPSLFVLKLLVDLGIPENNIRVVPNGVDVERFHPCGETRIANLILFVGRLHPTKGLHVLLEALNYLKTSVRLVIIGRPSSRCGYFRRIVGLIKMINEKTIHTVTYLGKHKPEEVIRWYQKASICVCPSLSESFGIVNLEAMACATPVVATCVGGIPEVVNDHKNGILVPSNDAAKLAEGVQYLLDNEEIRRKFGEEGRKCVFENFSSEEVARRLCNIYERMI